MEKGEFIMSQVTGSEFDYNELDEIIHARIRLAVMTILITREKCDFATLKKQTKTTDGNLSTHLRKLEKAGYVEMEKVFVKRKPMTIYWVSEKGKIAYQHYLDKLMSLVNH